MFQEKTIFCVKHIAKNVERKSDFYCRSAYILTKFRLSSKQNKKNKQHQKIENWFVCDFNVVNGTVLEAY